MTYACKHCHIRGSHKKEKYPHLKNSHTTTKRGKYKERSGSRESLPYYPKFCGRTRTRRVSTDRKSSFKSTPEPHQKQKKKKKKKVKVKDSENNP